MPAYTGPLTADDPRHGTVAGWNAHLHHDQLPACRPCFDAAITKKRQTVALHKSKATVTA